MLCHGTECLRILSQWFSSGMRLFLFYSTKGKGGWQHTETSLSTTDWNCIMESGEQMSLMLLNKGHGTQWPPTKE